MVTIDMVAKRAGVSKAAVSYAFSGSHKISEDTRVRILQIAAEMNYVPNRNAQLLRREKSKHIGLFIPRFSGSYYMYLAESLSMTLDSLGYQLEIHILRGSTQERICEIAGSNIDAAIINDPFNNSESFERLAKIMGDRDIPMVFFASEAVNERCSSVMMDNSTAFSWMADYLIETGHKKIIFIGGCTNFEERKRFEGFEASMKSHGMPIFDKWDYIGDDPCEWVGYQVVRAKFPQLTEKPDAFCCANDPLAIGCIKALNSFGYTVPKDVSVTGFDNLIPAQLFEMKLTTLSNQVTRMGKIAAEEAVRLLRSGEKGNTIITDSELIKGETVAVRV